MAGEIQLNSTTMATESSGSITAQLDTIRPNTTNGSLTLQGDSSDSGVTGLTIDSSGNATFAQTITGGTIGSSVVFPAIGQLAFWYGNASASSSITFTLDGVSSYTVIFNGRDNTTPFFPKNLTFIIDSSDGTITSKTDSWSTSLNESFNNSTKVLTLSTGSDTQVMSILIFKGAITEGT